MSWLETLPRGDRRAGTKLRSEPLAGVAVELQSFPKEAAGIQLLVGFPYLIPTSLMFLLTPQGQGFWLGLILTEVIEHIQLWDGKLGQSLQYWAPDRPTPRRGWEITVRVLGL